jgi:uncharacterized protein with gpF-like domain
MPKPTPHEVKTSALEKAFIPKLIRIIKNYRKGFIADLRANGQSSALSNLQRLPASPQLTKLINLIYRRAGLTGAKMTFDELKLQVVEKKAAFGRNEQWIADVIDYLKLHLLSFVQNITETMRADIIKALEKGIEEGMSIDQIVKQLQADGLIRSRARVIARTEINRATNVGHAVAAESLPYEVDKKWSAASDHRTRHSHRQINNHRVGEDDTFKVPIYKGDKPTGTFDNMLYPGDATASAGNTINCRCRVVYVPKRDAQGRLLMRNPNRARVISMREPLHSYTHEQIAAQLKANTVITVK